ncbi:VWA domain-containing protein [Neptunomonas sp.]|uniref:VWA domain-containing protein n=1 Tax=Neptunomonas TaxID=75687 RepID=UPI0035167CFA
MRQIDQLDQAADQLLADLNEDYGYLVRKSDRLSDQLTHQLECWKTDVRKTLSKEYPFGESEQKLEAWTRLIEQDDIQQDPFQAAFKDFFKFCKKVKYPENREFWQQQLNHQAADKNDAFTIVGRLLQQEWQKRLDKAKSEWELEKISVLRHRIFNNFKDILAAIERVRPLFDTLGLDLGIFFDQSKGKLSEQDFKEFQRWANYLAEDEGVQSLCSLLGRVRQIQQSEKLERVKAVQAFEVNVPDINSKEEIVGIRLGRDLEHVLPSEKALLSDPDTSLLFDLKYVESRLMCFDMQGMQAQKVHAEIELEQQVTEQEKQGPIVICVDTSGSMQGMPETIAKAVTLFMANKARSEQRPCYLINFSTRISTLDLNCEWAIKNVIDFLKMSFSGGTDVAPALNQSLKVMQKDEYHNADLLVISDFIMGGLPSSVLKEIEKLRVNGNRFYSLVVGEAFMSNRLKSLFDQEWIYDPQHSSIHELVGFQQRLSQEIEVLPV